jgi:hypothetical protein
MSEEDEAREWADCRDMRGSRGCERGGMQEVLCVWVFGILDW